MPCLPERLVLAVSARLLQSELPGPKGLGHAGPAMFFLLRACFWICVVWLLMPISVQGTRPQASGHSSVGTKLAAEAVGTAATLCRQQAAACQAVILSLAGAKPQPGGKPSDSTAEADLPIPLPVARPTKRKAG